MSDTICTQLTDTVGGIESAASSPTGLTNRGPEGYKIHFNPAQIGATEVAESLFDALDSLQTGTDTEFSLISSQVDADDPRRERLNPQHPSLPVLHVTVAYDDP